MSKAAEKKRVPKLRFPEFEGEWEEQTCGFAFDNRKERGKEGLPLYSVTLDRGLIPRDDLARDISSAASDESNLRVYEGDLVYNTMRMWQGAVGRATTDSMVSPAYVVLSPKQNTSSRFFDQWFERSRSLYDLWAYSHGLTKDRLRLYFDDFCQVPVMLPERKEQERVADLFDAVERRLRLLEQATAAQQEFKRGMMQRIFAQDVRFTRDDGSAFPKWENKVSCIPALSSGLKAASKSGAVNSRMGMRPMLGVSFLRKYSNFLIVAGAFPLRRSLSMNSSEITEKCSSLCDLPRNLAFRFSKAGSFPSESNLR